MKKVFIIVVLVPLVFFLDSCSLDDGGENINFVALRIADAELPESFALDETYEITLSYVNPDGCTRFEGINVVRQDTTVREVYAIGASYIERSCTQETTEMDQSFRFQVIYDQPYLFRFWQGEDANGDPMFLEIEVPVE